MPEMFTCSVCGETFPTDWTDEEVAEYNVAFSKLTKEEQEDCAVVCDNCCKEMDGSV